MVCREHPTYRQTDTVRILVEKKTTMYVVATTTITYTTTIQFFCICYYSCSVCATNG